MKLRLLSKGDKIACWTVIAALTNSCYSCQCDCGKVQKIKAHDLLKGRSKMCRSCSISLVKKGHGASAGKDRAQEYVSWQRMISRTTNPKDKDYENYGGRGIAVCGMWKDSYEAFLLCMGKAPGPGYTIERKDGNRGYEPGNCVWATKTEQNRNRRNVIRIEIDGVEKALSEWLVHFNVEKPNTVYKQISRQSNRDPKEILLEYVQRSRIHE